MIFYMVSYATHTLMLFASKHLPHAQCCVESGSLGLPHSASQH